VNLTYLTSFGLLGLTFVLMGLTATIVFSPVGRALPLAIEKSVMPMAALMLTFVSNLFRIAMRGVGDFYEPWEAYLNLGAVVMFVLVIFFTAFASARKQIKAAQAKLGRGI
jgi:hypothetical protein